MRLIPPSICVRVSVWRWKMSGCKTGWGLKRIRENAALRYRRHYYGEDVRRKASSSRNWDIFIETRAIILTEAFSFWMKYACVALAEILVASIVLDFLGGKNFGKTFFPSINVCRKERMCHNRSFLDRVMSRHTARPFLSLSNTKRQCSLIWRLGTYVIYVMSIWGKD